MQETVPVKGNDDADTLASRILDTEHRLYPKAIELLLNGGWKLDGRRFVRG